MKRQTRNLTGHGDTWKRESRREIPAPETNMRMAFYAQKDQEIVYKLALPAGTYRFASGYQEWWAQWNSGRSMAVSLRYTDAEGGSQTEDLGTITLGNDTAGHVLESSRNLNFRQTELWNSM